ncbi:adenylyltransferase/cytidyltransferase family protein [Candidatus Peregrinibacteria bacterium]|nr:adenylyltransferase/cytidyltransferase family protein [Candidatus Peregrinibacteria bacterium]
MKKHILVFGTFDELHPGHRFLLSEAQKRGELFVVIARDANVERIKGRPAVESEGERKRAVEKAYHDATVLLGDPHDFLVPVIAVRPDLILFGYDQKLPPGVREKDLECPVERLPAFEPEKYKSSLRRNS